MLGGSEFCEGNKGFLGVAGVMSWGVLRDLGALQKGDLMIVGCQVSGGVCAGSSEERNLGCGSEREKYYCSR